MSNHLTLPEQMALLCTHDISGKCEEEWAALGIDGAFIAELMLWGRVAVGEKERLTVANPAPIGDPLLDRPLARLASEKERTAWKWIGDLGKTDLHDYKPSLHLATLQRLQERGILTPKGVISDEPFYAFPTLNSMPEIELKQRLRTVVLEGAPANERETILLALVRGCKALDRVFSKEELKPASGRVAELCGMSAPAGKSSEAVARAVKAEGGIVTNILGAILAIILYS